MQNNVKATKKTVILRHQNISIFLLKPNFALVNKAHTKTIRIWIDPY